MATIPTPHTWTAGDDATSANLQTLTDTGLWGLGSATSGGSKRPLFLIQQSLAQTPATSTWTAATFDAETYDTDNGHSTVTNNDRYTCSTAGLYLVAGGSSFAGSATGRRGVRYTVNGTAVNFSEVFAYAAVATIIEVAGRMLPVFLNVNDILRCEIFQDSGAGLATVVTPPQGCYLFGVWLSN